MTQQPGVTLPGAVIPGQMWFHRPLSGENLICVIPATFLQPLLMEYSSMGHEFMTINQCRAGRYHEDKINPPECYNLLFCKGLSSLTEGSSEVLMLSEHDRFDSLKNHLERAGANGFMTAGGGGVNHCTDWDASGRSIRCTAQRLTSSTSTLLLGACLRHFRHSY